jgi:hypothetical protein
VALLMEELAQVVRVPQVWLILEAVVVVVELLEGLVALV